MHATRFVNLLLIIVFTYSFKTATGQGTAPGYSIESTYGYTYSEQMVEGGEGFMLFTRIYLPEGEGPWPLVMTRTPYAYGNATGDNLVTGQEYAKRGLGYVVQGSTVLFNCIRTACSSRIS